MISQLGCLASGPWQGLAVELKIDFVSYVCVRFRVSCHCHPVNTGIFPHSLPEWAFRARPDFGGFAFALKLPELLHTNLPTVKAKLGQTSSFPNGLQIWFPVGQCIWEPNW